jgi:hypothetical protein
MDLLMPDGLGMLSCRLHMVEDEAEKLRNANREIKGQASGVVQLAAVALATSLHA